ncbi:MAG TPA: cyclic nucleotide-binding domain-containing protein [Candidatus Limnocylindria bacterium]|jgi:CRP-like cAMP-binding protein
MKDEEIRQALTQSPVLADLDPNALQFLVRFGTLRTFVPGEALMREGEPSVSIHFVLSGAVTVERQPGNDEPSVTLADLGVGEVVGEMGILVDGPRSATIVAIAPTQTLELDGPSFERVGRAFPALHRVIATLLSGRLRKTSADVSGRRAADR